MAERWIFSIDKRFDLTGQPAQVFAKEVPEIDRPADADPQLRFAAMMLFQTNKLYTMDQMAAIFEEAAQGFRQAQADINAEVAIAKAASTGHLLPANGSVN